MTRNKDKNLEKQTQSLKDGDLFSVNVNKKGLKAQREKLAKDRFKEKQR